METNYKLARKILKIIILLIIIKILTIIMATKNKEHQ